MARIRTIKPDFWTSPQVVQISIPARLLFLGMLNFADDHGGIDRTPMSLKLKIFPGDKIDIEPLIQELLQSRDDTGTPLLLEYQVEGKKYLHITGFRRHQKIDRPSRPRVPAFDGTTAVQGALPLPENKGKGNGGGAPTGAVLEDPGAKEGWFLAVCKDLEELQLLEMVDLAYWRKILAWIDQDGNRVDVKKELHKFAAWLAGKPRRQRNLKQGFRNWIAKEVSWADRREMRGGPRR